MEENKILNYLKSFSLITVGENKRPNFSWKINQTEKISPDKLIKHLNYKGGIFKKDGIEIQPTVGIGVVTGFEFLECIDVDTKVFSTQIEMNEFWNEYYSTLKDSIINFDEKFVIYQTKSGGYHILYKSKRVVGNTKIASLKGHTEAVLETRGTGGYIFLYPEKKYGTRSYFDIDFISDEDREILWRISKAYNYVDVSTIEAPKKDKRVYKDNEVTPWDDFNAKTEIWEVIKDDFIIPRNGNKNKHTLVKRHGATSEHSGSIFHDSGCLYLFSTGTIYPHEKLISPFYAYTIKYHNGDFKEATKDLYEQGFGSRLSKEIDKLKPVIDKPIKVENVAFPIDIFPVEIQHYLSECSLKLDSNIDYMGSSLLWLISVCVGNSFEMEVKRGWIETGVVWISLVGKAGIGKTPSIYNVIFPLEKLNSKAKKNYIKAKEDFDFFQTLTKKEKEEFGNNAPSEPKKTQFIANDITLEALVELHQESDNSVGVFKDELAGWLKDMNKYRAGSDLEFWLSCWSSKSVSMNRKTARSSFVEKPFVPVMGGIQPSIFNSFSTEENKENGFLDRMLLSFPESVVDVYNDAELDYSLIKWYSESITQFYERMKAIIKRDTDNEIIPNTCRFSDDAKVEWIRIFNKITAFQNNEDENEYLKSMYPKQKSYIPRFAMLIHLFDSYFDENTDGLMISKESILKAEKLSDYFVMNAKKIKLESTEVIELKTASKHANTTAEKLQAIYNDNPEFNRTKVAELLGVSRRTIINWLNKLEK